MHISLKDPLDLKSFRSQLSNIDIFSKLQSTFLQKFFKYNLIDYFHSHILNLYEDLFDKSLKKEEKKSEHSQGGASKMEKYLSSSLFISKKKINIEELQYNIQNFYRNHSPSVQKGELPYGFKLKYKTITNHEINFEKDIGAGQLILVEVKIKAEVQKVQELPQKIMKYFESFRLAKKGKLSKLEEVLANYQKQYINFFIVYFGDINFQVYNKKQYKIRAIKLMGKFFQLRIFVFFVSKQALIETFRSINKIDNLEYINDLVIQFYQLKREKQRRKRSKRIAHDVQELHQQKLWENNDILREKVYVAIGVLGLVGIGLAMMKFFN